MKIRKLIESLEKYEQEGIENVSIMRKEAENTGQITTESYFFFVFDFENDNLILVPEYLS